MQVKRPPHHLKTNPHCVLTDLPSMGTVPLSQTYRSRQVY